MTFTELRKIKETVNRINKNNEVAHAHLNLTMMFLDGKWATRIEYKVLYTEDITLIIEVCKYLKLRFFFGENGIYIQ